MNDSEYKSVKTEILEAIKRGNVKMRPKWFFLLQSGLAIAGGALVGLTLLYLTSLIIFILRRNGVWFVPVFGPLGWFAFLISLPWLLIVLVLVFVLILEILVRHFSFAYRRPLLYSALGIVVLVVGGGFIVAATGFHRQFGRYADQHRLPFAGNFYRGAGHDHFSDIHRGVVDATTTDGFTMIMPGMPAGVIRIIITPRTRLPYGMDFDLGDSVVVFGVGSTNTIQAFGIQEIMDDGE